MPIRKFSSAADMTAPANSEPLLERLRALWRTSAQLNRRRFPPGVHKSRDMTEHNARTLEWARADAPLARAQPAVDGLTASDDRVDPDR